jgi:serpin B
VKAIMFAGLLAVLNVALMSGGTFGAEPVGDAKQAATDADQFATDLFARLTAANNDNLFFSPYSIETALAMTYAGAGGETARQMAQTLHLDVPADQVHQVFGALSDELNNQGSGDQRAFALIVANALWVQQGFAINPGFTQIVKKEYRAQLGSLDFASSDDAREQARKTVNDWVANQTHDKIKDLLPAGSLSAATRLVLTNAIYFKSNWENSFQKNRTTDDSFHTSGAQSHTVPMMHQTHEFPYLENDRFQAVELPYRLGRLSMVVLLPKKGDGLKDLEKSVEAKPLDDLTGGMIPREVELSLPKFTFSSHLNLSQMLNAMGMSDAFTDKADFSGISSETKLCIQQVVHQAYVAVDEEGTEAAAATGITFRMLAMRAPEAPVVFRADHPFIFVIRDRQSGVVLVLGRVMNPK